MHLTAALCLFVTITSFILSSNKMQNGDILVPAYAGCSGKWPSNEYSHTFFSLVTWLSLCGLLSVSWEHWIHIWLCPVSIFRLLDIHISLSHTTPDHILIIYKPWNKYLHCQDGTTYITVLHSQRMYQLPGSQKKVGYIHLHNFGKSGPILIIFHY